MKNPLKLYPNQFRTLSLAATAIALLFAASGNASAQCTSCVNAVTLPSGPVAYSSVNFNDDPTADPASGGNGFFTLNLTGVTPGTSLANQAYAAWCGAWYSAVLNNNGIPGSTVYSTYSPTFPTRFTPIVSGNTMNMVNYILNNKQGTVQDVQDAIWTIMTGHTDPIAPAGATALAMVSAAQANPGYVPSAFGVMAVFYEATNIPLEPNATAASNHLQNLLLEVPVPLANNNTPTLSCPSTTGLANSAYSSSLTGAGGTAPYTYGFTGNLPLGLTLNPATGLLWGVPSASGTYIFTGKATDNTGAVSTASCTINIQPPSTPLSLVCPTALTGQVGVTYNASLVAAGGTGQYLYSLAGGTLGGLSLNPTSGLISGLPSAAGSISFTGRVTDSGDSSLTPVTTTCGITIVPAPTALCPVITATQGVAISSVTLSASGGSGGSYTFVANGLPAGLSMSTSGQITGTPTVNGTFAYSVTITDGNGNTGLMNCSITVAAPPPPLTLSCPASSGTLGQAYSSSLSATGGSGSYVFSLLSGTLPTGLTLNSATGLISGIPLTGTTFTYTAKVSDGTNSAVAAVSTTCGLSLTGQPTASCVNIAGATQGKAITPVTLVGTAGTGGPYTFTATNLPAGLTMSTSGTISGTPSVNGTFSYSVKVTDKDGNSGTFTCSITIACPPPVISFTCPTSTSQVGVAYTSGLNPTGGTGHYAFSILSGGLPPYITLNTVSGAVSGTPNTSGSYTFTAQVSDTGNAGVAAVSKSCTIVVAPAPSTTCIAISATKGTAITPATLVGLNGAGAPYTFTASGLPTGITISFAGTFSGTPSVTGTFSYTITVKDKNGKSGTTTCSIAVAPPVVTNTPGISLTKTANVTRANPFQKVCYSYVVKNTGTVALTNITVVDDNATPGFATDDFTVGTVASLAPGASKTLSACIYPPVTEDAQDDDNDWGGDGYHSWGDDSNNNDGGTVICKELSNGDIQITYRQDKRMTDNTYGRGASSGWGYMGHSFSHFSASTDGVQMRILDKAGNVTLDFVADYLSRDYNSRSGYSNLGVKAGGGMVYKGNSAHVIKVDSSLNRNLNKQTKYNTCTKDSPSAGTPDWEDEQNYTVVISKEACAKYGFGGVSIPKVKNQCSKRRGYEGHTTHPSSSVATNTATASVTVNGQTIKATAKASVTIDASSRSWSQCSKY